MHSRLHSSHKDYITHSAIILLLMGQTVAVAAPSAAVRAACTADAKRFCADVIRDQPARLACMREHRAQLSEQCRTAIIEFRRSQARVPGESSQSASLAGRGSRRIQCIAYVQQDYRYKPKQSARPALQRCMQGEPIPAGFKKEEGF